MQKKIFAVLICFIMLISALSVSGFAAGIKYLVTSETAPVLDRASALGTRIFEVSRGDYVYVTETSDDFSHVTLISSGISGWIYTPLLTYAGEIEHNSESIKKITVLSLPDKTVYTDGRDGFDPAGLKVAAEKNDGTIVQISGYKLYVPALNSPGTKTVYVVYRPQGLSERSFSASFEITVVRAPVRSLTVTKYPTKDISSYIENQTLDLAGLELTAAYSDGTPSKTFTLSQILSDGDFVLTAENGKKLTRGTHTVNVYYKYPDVSCSFTVKVRERKLTSFVITSPPKTTTVYSKTMPDLTGLVLTATYDNGEVITVSPDNCTITCDPAKFILGKGNTMTIVYGGKSVTLDFTYALLEKTGLRLRLPQVLTFVQGEPIDLSAMEVYYVYSSGDVEKTTDFKRSGIDPMMLGAQTVTVTSGSFSTTFTIYINAEFRRGDIDKDGKVTASDARLALRNTVGLIKLGGDQLRAADADRDGKVTPADARLILRASVGLEDFLKDIRNTKV